MLLGRYLKSFFSKRDYKQDALYKEQDRKEVIASIKSSYICVTKKKLKLNFF